MDLSPRMTIAVTTTVTAAPGAGDRPVDLPEGADWPVPDGARVIYRVGYSSEAVCSDCIVYPSYVKARQGHIGMPLRQVEPRDNNNWYCTVPEHVGFAAGTRLR